VLTGAREHVAASVAAAVCGGRVCSCAQRCESPLQWPDGEVAAFGDL